MTDELRDYYSKRRAQHRDDSVEVDAPSRDSVSASFDPTSQAYEPVATHRGDYGQGPVED